MINVFEKHRLRNMVKLVDLKAKTGQYNRNRNRRDIFGLKISETTGFGPAA